MSSGPRDLGAGVLHFQSPLWETNSLLAIAGDEAVVLDPAYTPGEIEAIRAETERRGAQAVHILITHADFDHVCGIPYFPDAEVIAGEATAEKLRSSAAAEGLRANGPEWGIEWPTNLRCDRIVAPGELECGGLTVAAVQASSHGRDGTAFVLVEPGVLFPGDHVSAITYPLLGGEIPRVIEANRNILATLDRYDIRWVVPGHGPLHTAAETRAIAQADLAYLEALVAAAHEAVARELAPGYALLHVFAVEPPRPNTNDFGIYSIRVGNAKLALEQARATA